MKNDLTQGRLKREAKNIRAMLEIFCHQKHGRIGGLCPVCGELESYVELRLTYCRFGHTKPVCSRCDVHCYKPDMRERVREVMRFSGPQMTYAHPYLAIGHLWDKFRSPPRRQESPKNSENP